MSYYRDHPNDLQYEIDPRLSVYEVDAEEIKVRNTIFFTKGEELRVKASNIAFDDRTNLPKLRKDGKPYVKQSDLPRQSTDWWQAQCLFRGLASSEDIAEMQGRIRRGPRERHADIVAADARANARYSERLEAARQAKWDAAPDQVKAMAEPSRFLRGRFFDEAGRAREGAVAFTMYYDEWDHPIHEASRRFGLESKMHDTPHEDPEAKSIGCSELENGNESTEPYSTRAFSIAATFLLLIEEVRRVKREQARITLRKRMDDHEGFKHKEPKKADEPKQEDNKECIIRSPNSNEQWDVEGMYEVEGFGHCLGEGEQYALKLYYVGDGASRQLHGKFDIGWYKGELRFCVPDYPYPVFDIGIKDGPSAKNPTLEYVWRGTHRDEIQKRTDTARDKLTFVLNENGGISFHGTFGCSYCSSESTILGWPEYPSKPIDRKRLMMRKWEDLNPSKRPRSPPAVDFDEARWMARMGW